MSNSHFNKLAVEGFKPKAIVSPICRFFYKNNKHENPLTEFLWLRHDTKLDMLRIQ